MLRIRFDLHDKELRITGPDGKLFLTPLQLIEQRDELIAERDEIAADRDEIAAERDEIATKLDHERREKERALTRLAELEAALNQLAKNPQS